MTLSWSRASGSNPDASIVSSAALSPLSAGRCSSRWWSGRNWPRKDGCASSMAAAVVAIATGTRGNETVERRQFVTRAQGQQARGDVAIAVQFRERMRGPAILAAAMEVGAVLEQQVDHRDVPASRRDVQRRLIVETPGQIGVGAVLEQPARTGWVGRPQHAVEERRNSARECRRRAGRSDAATRAPRCCHRRR